MPRRNDLRRLLHTADKSAPSILHLSRWIVEAHKQAKRKSTLWRAAKARAALKDDAHGEDGEDGMILEGCELTITKQPNARKDRGIGSRSFAGVLARTESSCAGGANAENLLSSTRNAHTLLSFSFKTSSPSHYFPCEQLSRPRF
ncbi:hypothetical protein CPC08DRAFT_715811 [Agrocybe pediades]|nr:hypothetical protein CPC08DRAFT_715811 [Agrocybe pediades]